MGVPGVLGGTVRNLGEGIGVCVVEAIPHNSRQRRHGPGSEGPSSMHPGDQLTVLLRSLAPNLTRGYDENIAKLRARIGDVEFEAHRSAGATMSRSQAVNSARALGQLMATETVETTPAPRRRRGPRANPELTDREHEVLIELVRGHTNHDIAVTLSVAPKTVMHHTMNVYRKLGVRGRAEAITHALRTGLVPT